MPRRNEIILSDGERLRVVPSPDTAPRRPRWWNRRITLPLWTLAILLVFPLVYSNQPLNTQTVVDVDLVTRFFDASSPSTTVLTPVTSTTHTAPTMISPTATAQPRPATIAQTNTFSPEFRVRLNTAVPLPASRYSRCGRGDISGMSIVLASVEAGENGSSLYLYNPNDRPDDVCRLLVDSDALSPRWSPDDQDTVFSAVLGGQRDVFVRHASNELERITSDAREEFFVDWGSSTSHIWYLAEDSLFHQWTRDGGQRREEPDEVSSLLDAEVYDLAVAPNSRYFAFVSSGDNPALSGTSGRELYIASLTGANLRRLTVDDVPDSAPAWSPDSEWIVWVSGEPGQLWLYNVENDQRIRFTDSGAIALSAPVWLPDNDGIAFIAQAAITRVIAVQMFNGEVRVITGQFPNVTSFDWR